MFHVERGAKAKFRPNMTSETYVETNSVSTTSSAYQTPVAKQAFYKWWRKCQSRVEHAERHLFEAESSSDESDKDESLPQHASPNVMLEHDTVHERSLWITLKEYRFPTTVNPETDTLYLVWQFMVSICFVYNAFCIPLRTCFPCQSKHNILYWLCADYISDAIYIVDIVIFQTRRQFLLGGVVQIDKDKTKKNYLHSNRCRWDVVAVAPTDLLYLHFGVLPVLRMNRLVKLESYYEFNNRFEMILKQAYVFRVFRTTAYLLYGIHLNACLYYYISYLNDFKSEWGYTQEGHPYVRCYFWAFMTTTTIGNVPEPVTTTEYMLQLLNYFGGLIIFSIVIGQVRDSVQAANAEEEAYRSKKNACISYMVKNHIPAEIQKKVHLWFEYTWSTQKILDEKALLNRMPDKMHTDLAINVHMDVLSKVELFKECDRQLLYDLLLKLKPILYLPGDYVCRKGEVGREMYIITNGMVQVVGDKSSEVFASLYPGTAFGEISLLAIGGGNRRTANIYSPGYTTLFILLKNDLNEVVKNYPEAQKILQKKAIKMLSKDNKKVPANPVSSVATKLKEPKLVAFMHALSHSIKRSGKRL